MLKHRLLFGSIMIVVFLGLIFLDAYLDGSLTADRYFKILPVQATLFTLMILIVAIPAQLELSRLIEQTQIPVFKAVTIPATILLATTFYWAQFFYDFEFTFAPLSYYLPQDYSFLFSCLILAFSFLALFFAQAEKYGTEGTIRNISTGFFSIIYLGFLCSFILGIRINWGPWVLLLFILTIKSSDIGAYTLGRLFGKHKMAPTISPGKTWEGLGGAVLFAAAVAVGFSQVSGIMTFLPAAIFGAVFGVLGQAGDLVESMIKRDAASKDSSKSIPGFGGILDVIDSPLATAPAAFAWFMFVLH